MKKYLKVVIATMVVGAMMLAVGCSKPAEKPATAEKQKLVMATNAEFPPYEFYEKQEIVGIDVEIMKAVAESMGMELQIEDMAFDSIISALTSGKAQIGAAGMTVTEDRLVNVDFSDTYVTASQAILVKADNADITNAKALSGKKIGVQLGTTGDLYASDVTENVERFNKGFEAVQALTQGKIDAVVIDDQVAKALSADNADVKVLEEPFTTEEYAIAVKKGNTELLEKINAALADLKKAGTLDEIVGKYISAE